VKVNVNDKRTSLLKYDDCKMFYSTDARFSKKSRKEREKINLVVI